MQLIKNILKLIKLKKLEIYFGKNVSNMNYIGIRGHRGAGKKSIAYLLGQTIDYLIENEGKLLVGKTYDELYEQWVEDVMTNEDAIHDIGLDNVYFDSFADTLKLFVELLTGIPNEYIYNDHYKDHVVINIRDFSHTYYEEIPDTIQLLTRDELYKLMPKDSNPNTIMKNLYMTLREFILYFGIDVMQRFLGLNVWVKSLRQSEERLNSLFNEDNMYKNLMINNIGLLRQNSQNEFHFRL